jgi:hypothetical protein
LNLFPAIIADSRGILLIKRWFSMKKFIIFLFFIFSLTGCTKQSPVRVVTGIHVTTEKGEYHYSSPKKVEKYLYYLRWLDTWGFAELDALSGPEIQINLAFHNGTEKNYRLRGFQCLSVDHGNWLKIRPDYAEKLELLLEAVPPDGENANIAPYGSSDTPVPASQ